MRKLSLFLKMPAFTKNGTYINISVNVTAKESFLCYQSAKFSKYYAKVEPSSKGKKVMVHTVQLLAKLKNSYGKSCIFKKLIKWKRQMNEYAESMNNYVHLGRAVCCGRNKQQQHYVDEDIRTCFCIARVKRRKEYEKN